MRNIPAYHGRGDKTKNNKNKGFLGVSPQGLPALQEKEEPPLPACPVRGTSSRARPGLRALREGNGAADAMQEELKLLY